MRFPPGDPNQYAIKTAERESDPDIVVMRAVAGASLRLADCVRVSSTQSTPSLNMLSKWKTKIVPVGHVVRPRRC